MTPGATESGFWLPLFTSMLAGAATGIGGLIVLAFGRVPGPGPLAFSLALAGSVMLTVSFADLLLPMWSKEGIVSPTVAAAAGALCFRVLAQFFPDPTQSSLLPLSFEKDHKVEDPSEVRARSWRLGMILMDTGELFLKLLIKFPS